MYSVYLLYGSINAIKYLSHLDSVSDNELIMINVEFNISYVLSSFPNLCNPTMLPQANTLASPR